MDNITTTPEYLFESSWEVCNKVGGIYTVLSTKAHTLQQLFKDKLIFIGPDVWANTNAPDFIEDDVLFADWRTYTETTENLKVKVGRWNVPGTPPVILVDFKPFFKERDSFFYSMWESFRPVQRMDVGNGCALHPKANPGHRNALHDTCHFHRTFYRRKQQSPVCIYGRL